MSDFTTSLTKIFNERISSPFYGSLIVSWLLWNWEIPYVTFFVDQTRLGTCINKIDYINTYCGDLKHMVWLPLLSTAVILLALPYVTNGAFWVTERFETWRVNKKNEVQGKRLISRDEQLQLMMEIQNQEEKYSKIFIKKDEEISSLRKQLELATKKPDGIPDAEQLESESKTIRDLIYKEELNKFLNNQKILSHLGVISSRIQRGQGIAEIPIDIVNYYLTNDIIKSIGKGVFEFTDKGLYFLKEYTNRKFENQS